MSEIAETETVVFLGNLTTAPYAIHIAQAKSFGFTVSNEITKFTNYVVCGKDAGTKVDEARELGLAILNEEEWEAILIEREKSAKTVDKRPRKFDSNGSNDSKDDKNKDDLDIKLSARTTNKKRLRKSDSDDNKEDVNINDDDENNLDDMFDKPTTYMIAKTRFWEIRLDGRKTYIRTGKVGEKGLTTMKEHKTWMDARDSMTSLIERKLRQGFTKRSKQVDDDSDDDSDDDDGSSKKKERRGYKKPRTSNIINDETNTTLLDDGIDTSANESVISNDPKNYTSSKQINNTSKRSRVLPPSFVNTAMTSIMSGNKPGVLLADTWKSDIDPTGWWISEKLDGVRAFWCGKQGKFFSRLGNVYVAPNWFTKDLPKDVDLDGELFGGRGKFQSTVSIVKAGKEEWKSISYKIFDVPSYADKPFEARMSYLDDMFSKRKMTYARIVEQRRCKSTEDIWDELKRVESMGAEGLMLRKPQSLYVCGRSNTLLKVKSFFDGEAVVEGYEPGKGKYQGMTGALKCVMACGTKFKVGSGMSDNDRRKPPKIGSIIVYKCQELSNSGNPRFPTFVGIAADKTEPKDPDFGHKKKIK